MISYSQYIDCQVYAKRYLAAHVGGLDCLVDIDTNRLIYICMEDSTTVIVQISEDALPYYAVSIDGDGIIDKLIKNGKCSFVVQGQSSIEIGSLVQNLALNISYKLQRRCIASFDSFILGENDSLKEIKYNIQIIPII